MAEEDDQAEDEASSGGDGGGGGSKKLIIIVALVVLLLGGGAAGAYFTGLLDSVLGESPPEDMLEGGDGTQPLLNAVFYELPELLVNLNTGDSKSTFLKVQISLEIEKASDIPMLEELMPRILDGFQIYLRELRVDDLKGSAGMYRLREELLGRVSTAAAPVRINDVLFREMLIQ